MSTPEDNNVAWRLYSESDKGARNQIMYSMPTTPGENEPNSYPVESEATRNQAEILVWIIRFTAASYLIFTLYTLLQNDEIRLHVLHGSIRFLHSCARLLGGWAIQTEALYNNYVDTLH